MDDRRTGKIRNAAGQNSLIKSIVQHRIMVSEVRRKGSYRST